MPNSLYLCLSLRSVFTFIIVKNFEINLTGFNIMNSYHLTPCCYFQTSFSQILHESALMSFWVMNWFLGTITVYLNEVNWSTKSISDWQGSRCYMLTMQVLECFQVIHVYVYICKGISLNLFETIFKLLLAMII